MERKGRSRFQPTPADLTLAGLGREQESVGPSETSEPPPLDDTVQLLDESMTPETHESGPGPASTRGPMAEESKRREGLERARAALTERRFEDAINAYLAVVRLNPADVATRIELGALYDQIGEHDRAADQLRAAQQEDPENPEILTLLGTALGAVGRFDDAERELQRALRLAPDSLDARAGLGILYFRKGLYAQADHELRAVCLRDGEHGPAHFYRGEALTRLGNYDDAIASLERAIEIQPLNARAHYLLGILFDRKYLHDRAAAMYRRARELNDS